MHIIVCIKQTPATANIQIDPKTGTLKREGMAAAINPFDEYAIEEAVRIKERVPNTTVSVVTMGPPQAEDALRDAIARGCDDAYHVTDRAFAGADTWATSYTLQLAIQKIAEVKKAEKANIGLGGPPTIVAKSYNPPPRKGGERIEGATPEEKAKKLVARLRELKLI